MRAIKPQRIALAAALLILVVVVVVAGTGTAWAHALPRLLTQDGHNPFRVRPVTIGYTGDGTGYVGKFPIQPHRGFLHWKVWNHQRAQGTATIWLNNCTPSCAGGSFHSYRGSVRAFRVRHGDFTRMTLSFRYQGRSVTDERGLVNTSSPDPSWGIIKQTGF
ncbi:MAG: hypothetical protein ABI323_14720 [Solirubrobacteraceae bacterium]